MSHICSRCPFTRRSLLGSGCLHVSPKSNIWIIGHSLGGALASLLGATFGAPVVTFECPGDRLASTRLHLPSPVSFFFQFNFRVLDLEIPAVDPPHHTRLPHS